MAPVANRRTISDTGSTSSSGTAGRTPSRNANNPRSVPPSRLSRSTVSVYSQNTSYRRCRVACWSRNTVSGLNRCSLPRGATGTHHRRRAGDGRARMARPDKPARVGRRPRSRARRGQPRRVGTAYLRSKRQPRPGPNRTTREDLGADIGRDRGDAHLRHHLEHALAQRPDVVPDRLLSAASPDIAPWATTGRRWSRTRGTDLPRRRQ